MNVMPASMAARTIRVANFSSIFWEPRWEPPTPMQETRSPVPPKERVGIVVMAPDTRDRGILTHEHVPSSLAAHRRGGPRRSSGTGTRPVLWPQRRPVRDLPFQDPQN